MDISGKLIEKFETQQITDSFKKSLNINPFYTEAYFELATTHLKTNNKESARQSLEKGLQAEPNNLKFRKLYNKVLAS